MGACRRRAICRVGTLWEPTGPVATMRRVMRAPRLALPVIEPASRGGDAPADDAASATSAPASRPAAQIRRAVALARPIRVVGREAPFGRYLPPSVQGRARPCGAAPLSR